MERTGVIIVAGGSGSRAGGARPKQFRFLGGMPVLARTINTFAAALPGAEIVAVLPEQHIGFWKNLSARFDVAEHKIAPLRIICNTRPGFISRMTPVSNVSFSLTFVMFSSLISIWL